jgi:uncharacterized membrane protein (UPF0127 family)
MLEILQLPDPLLPRLNDGILHPMDANRPWKYGKPVNYGRQKHILELRPRCLYGQQTNTLCGATMVFIKYIGIPQEPVLNAHGVPSSAGCSVPVQIGPTSRMWWILLVLLCALLWGLVVRVEQFESPTRKGTFFSPEGGRLGEFDVEIANSPKEIRQGFMYRTHIPHNRAMMFYVEEQPQSFWMKHTPVSLDILYLNSQYQVMNIHSNTTPFSEAPLPSEGPAAYVIEVVGGTANRLGIIPGSVWQIE